MILRSILGVAVLLALSAAACTVDDADRCPKGYFFMEELRACCNEETHESNKDGTQCVPIVADSGPSGDAGSSGFDEPCTSQEDCAGYEASYCLLGQVCTFEDCDVTPCPDGWTCCGPCATSDNKNVCVPDDYVGLAITMGCACDS